MNVVVVLPTHNRSGPLRWSLASILGQRFSRVMPESKRVVVVNNGGDEALVEKAVAFGVAHGRDSTFEVSVVHRRPAMDPVHSWYSAIADHSVDGDVVFLHGDDDLMLRDSLDVRTALLKSSGASVLLTESLSGLIFDDHGERAFFHSAHAFKATTNRPATRATVTDVANFGAAFIGNHAYRRNSTFDAIYGETLRLMERVPLAGTQKLAMLPYFLPLLCADHGALSVARTTGCIRGCGRSEFLSASFGNANWLPGVLYAASLWLLTQPPLRNRTDLESVRAVFRRDLAEWLLPTLASRRTREMLLAFGLTNVDALRPSLVGRLARGAGTVAKSALGLRARRAQRRGWGVPYDLDEYLKLSHGKGTVEAD